jgi:UDP-GlcNAc:undecaprenyl-phosphate GlcNAc-1-phosphate transferase
MLPFPLFLFSFAGAFLLSIPVRVLAIKIGAVDHPGGRHTHNAPTPRLGGLAVAGAMAASLLQFNIEGSFGIPLLLGGYAIVCLGVRDDTKGLTPLHKLAWQITAALLAVFGGVRLEGIGLLSVPATLLWLLLLTNAYNLIDGLDGLCAGCGGMGGSTFALLGLLMGDGAVTAVGLSLLGGCLGFLPHNVRQQKLFLGDTGAQLIGFCMGLLSVRVINEGGVYSALLAVSYPLIETATTILRRIWQGKSPLIADRGHFHHRLTDRGLSHRKAVRILLLPSLFCTMVGLLLPVSPSAAGWVILLCFAAFLILLDTEGLRKRHKAGIPPNNR